MRQLMQSILLALAILAFAVPALACSCVQFSNPREQLRSADVVFIGRVVRSERDWLDRRWIYTTFDVQEALRGSVPRRVRIAQRDGTSCGIISFERGSREMVFAHRNGRRLTTSACSMPRFSEAEYRAALRPLYR
jgi:hypothetical protein